MCTCTMYLKERAEKRAEEKLLILSLKLEQMDKPQKYGKQLNQMKSDLKTCMQELPDLKDRSGKSLRKCKVNRDHVRMGFYSIYSKKIFLQ